jgi:hypothetical protein
MRLLIVSHKGGSAVSFAASEAIQNDKIGTFGNRPQLFQEISWWAVETDIEDRFLKRQGCLDKVQAENVCQTARVIIPDDIIADEQSPQDPIEVAYSRTHAIFFRHRIPFKVDRRDILRLGNLPSLSTAGLISQDMFEQAKKAWFRMACQYPARLSQNRHRNNSI